MPIYGHYETVRELASSAVGSVWSRRPQGSAAPPALAIKLLQPSDVAPEIRNLEEHVALFLDSANVQKQAAAASPHWAPILDAAAIPGGAYYVTNQYEQSAQRLVGRMRMSSPMLFELMSAIVAGILDLQKITGRAHGNLKPSNILILRKEGSTALADPAPAARITAASSIAKDLERLGQLTYMLVTGRAFDHRLPWPLDATSEWSDLGRGWRRWLHLCNFLLDPNPSAGRTLEEARHRLATVRPRSRTPLVVGAAALAVLGAFGAYQLRPGATVPTVPYTVAPARPASASLALSELLATSNSNAGFPLKLRTEDGRNEYVADRDTVQFVISAGRDCYLTVLARDASGAMLQLWPNGWDKRAFVSKDEEITIPPRADFVGIPVRLPAGLTLIKAVATPRPLQFLGITIDPNGKTMCPLLPAGTIASIGDPGPAAAGGAGPATTLDGFLDAREWAAAELTYTVRPANAPAGSAGGGTTRGP